MEELKRLFWSVVENDDVDILSIATRPDCLEEDKIELLAEINKVKPVWVELGLQTVNEKTADYIRRGYRLPVYDDAVRRLKKENIDFIVHMIIGLPRFRETTDRNFSGSPADLACPEFRLFWQNSYALSCHT